MPLTLKNFYKTWWQPWANTLAYWKFDGNLDSWFSWWATLSWTPYWYTTWLLWQAIQSTSNTTITSSLTQWDIYWGAFAMAFCVEMLNSNTLQRIFKPNRSNFIDIQYEFYNDFSWFQVYNNWNTKRIAFPLTNPWVWVWKKFVLTWDGVNQIELYIDWVKTNPYSSYNQTFDYPTYTYQFEFCASDSTNIAIDELIIENKHWTQTDVDNYLSLFN
jgi:hypothetical protein